MHHIDPNQQLDAISRAIGNFEAYVQEFRLGNIAITELIKSNEKLSCERDEALKCDIHTKIDKELLDVNTRVNDVIARLLVIENSRLRAEGVSNLGTWFLRNWPIAGLLTTLAGIIAWANDKV